MRKLLTVSRAWLVSITTLVLAVSLSTDAFAQRTKTSQRAGEQRKAETGLKDNRYFFYFIDSSISNLGTGEEKKLFREAIQRDILAQLLYMKFQFKESYGEIRKAQRILIDLYGKTLARDIGIAGELLNGFAPRVIELKDVRARGYLHLGYRDMKSAQTAMMIGDNITEKLYSMRLYQYVRAIKLAKHAKRYAFLSLIEISTPREERRPVNNYSFGGIEERLTKIGPDDSRERHLLIHWDNYYRAKTSKSFYDEIWDNPALQELEDYKSYLSRKEYIEEGD